MSKVDIELVYGDSHELAAGLEVVRDDLEDNFGTTQHHYVLREAQVHITGMYAAALEQQAEIDQLRAKVAELKSEWQSIESAPKDGTRILLFFPNDVGVISGEWNFEQFYANPKPHFTHDQEQRWGVRHMRANQPTHWQPLPPAPIAKAQGVTK